MRINDIISEAVSLTKYDKPVQQAIRQGIIDSLDKMENWNPNASSTETLDSGDTAPLHNYVTNGLRKLLPTIISTRITEIGTSIVPGVTAKFEYMESQGQIEVLRIYLNMEFIDELVSEVGPFIEKSVIDNARHETEILESWYDVIPQIKEQASTLLAANDTIALCASTFIHELVHAYQHNTQYAKDRDETEYRSYAAPLDKFQQTLSATKAQKGDYRIYRASPQEMAAFAHQDALRFVQSVESKNGKFDQATMQQLTGYIDKTLKDPENPKEAKIHNRYVKLVYQEVMRYIQSLNQQQ